MLENISYYRLKHPLCIYGKFHQAIAKDPNDVLRRIHVPELQATLNSQVAEQLFACLSKNNYFLNNMGSPASL